MKKLSYKKGMALVAMGMLFQFGFGGCNFNRILGSLVDHTIYTLVNPFLSGFTDLVVPPAA